MRVIDVKGHPFNFLGTEDHLRRDGDPTVLYRWTKRCEHPGCRHLFDFLTPALNQERELVPPEHPSRHYWKNFDQVLCREHRPKVPRKKTPRRTLPTTYQGRRRGNEADIKEMHDVALKLASEFRTQKALLQALALVYPFTPGTIREILSGRRRAIG